MNTLGKAEQIWDRIQEYILIITGSAVCILIIVSALMRQVLKIDLYGSEEIILFIAFWLYFIGSMYAAKKDTHINANMISMFTDNKKVLILSEIVKEGISLVLNIVVLKWCFDYVMWSVSLGRRSDVFKLPHLIGQLPILISFFMWIFYTLRRFIGYIRGYKDFKKGSDSQ